MTKHNTPPNGNGNNGNGSGGLPPWMAKTAGNIARPMPSIGHGSISIRQLHDIIQSTLAMIDDDEFEDDNTGSGGNFINPNSTHSSNSSHGSSTDSNSGGSQQ